VVLDRPAILSPATAAAGNRARELLAAVNAASHSAQTGWLIFLLLTAYYVVALGGISDKDLLLNAPIALPLLGISTSLAQFFLIAPPLFIMVHFSVLIQNVILVRKVYAFLQVIEAQELAEAASTGQAATHGMRYELASNFFTQFLAGPPQSPMIRFFLQVVVWGTLVLLPVAVLLAFQIEYLPVHDVTATWLHRSYVLVDIGLIALIGVFLPSPHERFWRAFGSGLAAYPGFYAFTTLSFIGFMLFSFALATVPGEWLDRTLARFGPSRELAIAGNGGRRAVFTPTALLFEGPVDGRTGRRGSLFHRNLIVMDENVVRERDLAPGDISVSLRFRDLRYARLDRTDLARADLTCADITGAVIDKERAEGAKFGCPQDAPGSLQ
jgi:hypothetical protein